MRHRKRSRRLVGKWEHRQALLRNLLMALFLHERIRTTEAKAKELRRLADKMIVLAKRGDLAARRQALSILPNKMVVRKLFSEIKDRYLDRQSGFTRIVRLGPRRGDAAMMVFIELVTDKLEHKRSPKKIKEETEAMEAAPKKEGALEEAPEEQAQLQAEEKGEEQQEMEQASEQVAEQAEASGIESPTDSEVSIPEKEESVPEGKGEEVSQEEEKEVQESPSEGEKEEKKE